MANAVFKAALGNNFNNVSGTTLAITTTAAIAIGDLVVVRWASDNLSATTPTATCADSGGNSYTVQRQAAGNATAAAGIAGGILTTKATVAVASGGTITLTFSGAIVGKAAYAESFTGVNNTTRVAVVGSAGTTGTAATSGASATGAVAGDLALGFSAVQTRAAATGDTDTTSGSWSAIKTVNGGGTSGQDATSVQVNGQYKLITGTGAQTFDNTVTSTYWVTGLVILQAMPDPTITQASYRLYADGTESGSTALANQDTAYSADVTAGDVVVGVRTRLQNTSVNVGQASDAYQVQWEKNGNGTWTNVTPPYTLLDTYPSSNYENNSYQVGSTLSIAQSFHGDGRSLSRAGFYLGSIGTPTGNMYATLYAHSGTFGSTGVPTGTALATSTARPCTDVTTTNSSPGWYYFDFPSPVVLTNGTAYFIALESNGNGSIYAQADATSPTHAGNMARWSSSTWSASGTVDVIFEVYVVPTVVPTTAVAYDSPNLTNATATTNRLGAGTGSFVAGVVSEVGSVSNYAIAASNYTELLYSITLKRADLANSDTLRFRVLYNGATTAMTYSSTPTINVTKSTLPLATFTDSFTTTVDKTTNWPASSAQVVWDSGNGGQCLIPCTSSYYSLNTVQGASAGYNLKNSSVFAKITTPAVGTGTREVFMEVDGTDTVNQKISMFVSGTTFAGRTTTAGVNSANVWSLTYNPAIHGPWWRIRETGNTIYWDYSTDAYNWTNAGSVADVSWDMTKVSLGFSSGYYGTESAANTYIDEVNVAPFTLSQASYRLYADGTESGSTALAAQDTAYTADVTAGDVNLGLRVRLQDLTTMPGLSTDNYQLQWDKNNAGAWANVAAGGSTVDTYAASNYDSSPALDNNPIAAWGQSFTGNGTYLTQAGFYLVQIGSVPNGTVTAALYAHTGTFGSTGVPTGAALASSTTVINSSTVPVNTPGWVYFNFDGTYLLANGTPYFIVVSSTNTVAPGALAVGSDGSSPTHAGNAASFAASSWSVVLSRDLVFIVTGAVVAAVVPYASANLTDGAATTNRLGAGTGSFVAGKVSETGLVSSLAVTASNYTELLYSITLKSSALANSDAIRFRILLNAAVLSAYASTPTINVTVAGAGNPVSLGTASSSGVSTVTAAAVVNEGFAATGVSGASTVTGAMVVNEGLVASSAGLATVTSAAVVARALTDMAVSISDTFNRADGSVGTVYSAVSGFSIPSIVSNQVKVAGGATYGGYWNNVAFGADQYVGIDVTLVNGYAAGWPMLRTSGAGPPIYSLLWDTNGVLWLTTNNTSVGVITSQGGFPTSGTHRVAMRAIGTRLLCYFDSTVVFDVTDSTVASGQPGFGLYSADGSAIVDNFFASSGAASVNGTSTVSATTLGSVKALAGSSSGTSTVTDALSVGTGLAASANGVATVTASTLTLAENFVASVAGTSIVTADLTVTPRAGQAVALAGESDGTSTVIAALVNGEGLASVSSGTSTVTAALAVGRGLVASSAGVATVTAAEVNAVALAASSVGLATVTATTLVNAPSLVSVSAGLSTVTGALAVARALSAPTVSGTSTVTGALTDNEALVAASAGSSTVTAALAVGRGLVGSSAGVATDTATEVTAVGLVGASAGTSNVIATTLLSPGQMSAASNGTSTVTAALSVNQSLAGSSAGLGAVGTPMLNVGRGVAGSSAGVATDTALLGLGVPLVSQSNGVAGATASLREAVALAGSSSGTSTASASFGGGGGAMSGESDGTSSCIGILSNSRPLVGSSAGTSTDAASVSVARGLSSHSDGTSGDTGTLVERVALAGSSAGTSTAVANPSGTVLLVGVSTGHAAVSATLSLLDGRVRVWNGSSWVLQTPEHPPLRVWDGSTWDANATVWTGAKWQPLNPQWR